jgi:hypothetical protein
MDMLLAASQEVDDHAGTATAVAETEDEAADEVLQVSA